MLLCKVYMQVCTGGAPGMNMLGVNLLGAVLALLCYVMGITTVQMAVMKRIVVCYLCNDVNVMSSYTVFKCYEGEVLE